MFFLEVGSGCGEKWEEMSGGVLLSVSLSLSLSCCLHTPPSAHQFIRLLRGTLSPEEKPWVGVCNFWWMNTSLTHSSFIWLFNLDSVSFPISHLLSLWTSFFLSFWPLLLAQDSGFWFNWIVLNSGSLLHLLWSSQRLFDSDFLWSLAL